MAENLYEEMAQAMRDRQTALNGVERWQSKLQETQARIEAIGAKLAANAGVVPDETVTPQVDTFSHVAATTDVAAEFSPIVPTADFTAGGIDPSYSESAE